MTARSSDPRGSRPVSAPGAAGRGGTPRRGRRTTSRRERRGAALALIVLTLLVLLGSAGLAIDLGRGYVTQVQLSRAVDAGALAAARVLRNGEAVAREEAEAVARANGVAIGIADIATQVAFGTNDRGENTVTFTATRTLPTVFMRVLGIDMMNLRAEAEAAVPPLDIVIVLDTSGSLEQAGAWGALQQAARTFIGLFSDEIDQIGLATFQINGFHTFWLRPDFTAVANAAIDNMLSGGDTNIQEGLNRAREQITSGAARPSAAKVVVFFTDGRPTAVRGNWGPGGVDRIVAIFGQQTLTMQRGFFNNPDAIPPHQVVYPTGGGNPPANWPGGCRNQQSACPATGLTHHQINALAQLRGLQAADALRQEDILVYVIGLGDPTAASWLVPDPHYLRQIANEGGISNPSQPQGQMYFAPSGAELVAVFEQVAQDLIVRLAR